MKALSVWAFILSAHFCVAQTHLPVIMATSKKVTIKDGGFIDKDAWTLSPENRPDVYTADRTRKTKWVTFYTDIDSIRVKVKPGTRYNFVILFNGKDSCYTQIASAIPPETSPHPQDTKSDTIPFTLTAYNAIKVKAIIDNSDTLAVHFDASSFSFHLTRDAILKKTNLLPVQPDAVAGNFTPDYNRLRQAGKLQIGSAVWTNPEILPTAATAHDMDGRLGWTLFDGKMIQVDYDRNLLIISHELPKELKGYTKVKIEFIRSIPCIEGSFEINGKKYTGRFAMDTGSEEAIILDGSWTNNVGFPQSLHVIKLSTLSDAGGNKYETKLVSAPSFGIKKFVLSAIPTMMINGSRSSGSGINYLGNDLLKRFNIIMDFKHDCIYLKPNKLFYTPYRKT